MKLNKDSLDQCDQTVRLFFNIWPLATITNSPIMYQICQSRLNILTNKKKTIKNLPKDLQSFAKVAKFRQIWSHCDADAKFAKANN